MILEYCKRDSLRLGTQKPWERAISSNVQAWMRRNEKLLALGGFGLAAIGLAVRSIVRSRHPIGNSQVPEPRKNVDLRRYLGRWFEIARYEQWFEKGCEGATAHYSLRQDGTIGVINRCRKPGRNIAEARGRAKVADPVTNAKLKVSFFGPFFGNYWVLDHAIDYSWSIVGEPSGRYLWILAREATPAKAKVRQLISRAKDLGYDTSMLLLTKQP